MASWGFQAIAQIAAQRWGLVTTAQAEHVGVSRVQMARMADSGSLERIAQGVYRVVGAPEFEHEQIYATWLALGGATREPREEVPAVVAAGVTAAQLHGVGQLWPDQLEFIVPSRRETRLPGVRLRTRHLTPEDVGYPEAIPTLSIERTVGDLVGEWTDLSLVADLLSDALDQGKPLSPQKLAEHLDPLATRQDFADGRVFATELLEMAGMSNDEPAMASLQEGRAAR